MNRDGEHEPNSILEPNAKDFEANTMNSLHDEGGHDYDDGPQDESRLCLLDSACTACMHSRRWRQAYERTLPAGLSCQKTDQTKVFHFANGASTEDRVAVWEIPIFLGGRRGQVYSAELPEGSTPLLLSIPAMTALDMTLQMKQRKVLVQSLNIELPMFVTKTKHLAVEVAYKEGSTIPELSMEAAPSVMSDKRDLMVYYSEEAEFPLLSEMADVEVSMFSRSKDKQQPTLGARGVLNNDARGQLSERRAKELQAKAQKAQAVDSRTWAALKRQYSLAEQWATKSFSTTVLFEPFGGNFGVTRVASHVHGWTNSQPLDLMDGYDIISPGGQRLLWKVLEEHDPYMVLIAFPCTFWSLLCNLSQSVDWGKLRRTLGRATLLLVVRICVFQHRRGRFFLLLENPAGSMAWVFEKIIAKLFVLTDAVYTTGDQCRYGKVDLESSRPIKKPTGWLSNNQFVLNQLGRKCTCRWGSHQQVLGSNQFGSRALQAAAYPEGLSRAICSGILMSMKFEYSLAMSYKAGSHSFVSFELAFPARDEVDVDMEEADREEVTREDAQHDKWTVIQPDRLIREHFVPRLRLFMPAALTEPPIPIHRILPGRRTVAKYLNHNSEVVDNEIYDDEWATGGVRSMYRTWVGHTEFRFQPEELQERFQPVAMNQPSQPELVDFSPLTPAPATPAPGTPGILQRRRARTRQLQRGFWTEIESPDVVDLLERTSEHILEQGAGDWTLLDPNSDLFTEWQSHESANADVVLALCSHRAKRMKKPQPHAGPADVPVRRSYLLLAGGEDGKQGLSTDWEDWAQMAPSSQQRPLVGTHRVFYMVLYGKPAGEADDQKGDKFLQQELERERKWQVLPRELKLALRRVHINLGHASPQAMMKALRISRASTMALKACRLFRCADCPRLKVPKLPRPSKLPVADEFNTHVGVDIISEKDSTGQSWQWLNILCQGTSFQVCILLGDTNMNPTGKAVLAAFHQGWTSWAGFPEVGVIADRAKYFLSSFAEDMADHGCRFDTAAKASPWQIGMIERHGGLWKETFRRTAWSQQVAGKDEVLATTSATNAAKNSLCRKGGFSPNQWVLGKDIRLPASLVDDDEVNRIGSLALASTPGTKFHRKHQLRMAARQACTAAANSEALRRAELRQVRPHRGPWLPGMYCFYYDGANKDPGPSNWRGVARVIGSEGSHTIWISHRGLLLAVSPEHLARAFDQEVRQWAIVDQERELIDAMPAAGGTGFIDLRKTPLPPALTEGAIADVPESQQEDDDMGIPIEGLEQPPQRVEEPSSEEQAAPAPVDNVSSEDLSASSTSMARMKLESDRDQRRMLKSSEFFDKRARERREARERRQSDFEEAERLREQQRQAEATPIEEDVFDEELHDYHQSRPTRQLTPVVEDPAAEANEREAKRLRVSEDSPETANFVDAADKIPFAFMATEQEGFLEETAYAYYMDRQLAYEGLGVSLDTFIFGMRRNDFYERYKSMQEHAMQGTALSAPDTKKKGRKEVKLHELKPELRREFTKEGGSDQREWDAWKSKEACDVLSPDESRKIQQNSPELIISTRWVRTNKNDGLQNKEFLAKSRLVVQGFKDRSLGHFRRDAPTASAIAESIVLAICAYLGLTLFAKDIKNAYFSGRSLEREVYLSQPRGGLPGLQEGQLLRARKAIYGFAEAARMFWLALREYLISDGWQESRLEPALFYLRQGNKLRGILVSHVDDLEGGIQPDMLETAFSKSSQALEFATNHYRDFIFRGREIHQTPEGHVDVSMKNYALSMKPVRIEKHRRQQLDSELTKEELDLLQSSAGELGWITRQLRCDLAFENGVIQRCKTEACIADLVRLKQYVGQARRGANFRLRYWSDVNLSEAVVVHLADSGFANGSPEHNGLLRYRSVGGYFILLANKEILQGQPARCNMICFQSSQTKRVCRSTLAAEASHLAEAVEAGDWVTVVLEEALTGDVDLRNWQSVIERRERVYVTDTKSVYDYLHKDATSTSTDKRMAIEGALLRETVRKPKADVRWIDGMQNIANVLTKHNAEKDTLREFLRTGQMSLTQTEANQKLKEKRRQERQSRSEKKRSFKETNKEADLKQKRTAKAEAIRPGEADTSEDEPQPKEKQ